jgi:ferredoxin
MIPCEFEYVSHFHEGRALYKDNGLSGYINKQGDIVIPAKYDNAGHIFEDGIVLVNPDTCIGCKLCSWACPYGAREYDYDDGVMKKCTLCVDRIYNENIPEEDRVPACVRACPTGARAFGDLGDPDSAVSQSVAARGGFNLLEEFGYQPVNKYLPPRAAASPLAGAAAREEAAVEAPDGSAIERLFAWADRAMSR